jgi:hypothetical protein
MCVCTCHQFYESLPDLDLSVPIIAMGDWNIVERHQDRISYVPFTLGRSGLLLQRWLRRHNLVDVSIATGCALGHTWWDHSRELSARLDRFYASDGFVVMPKVSLFQPNDHTAIIASIISSDAEIGPGRWILNTRNLSDPELRGRIEPLLQSCLAEASAPGSNPSALYSTCIDRAVDICKEESKRIHRDRVSAQLLAQDQLRVARAAWEADPSPANHRILDDAADRWRVLQAEKIDAQKISAKTKFYLDSSRFTHELHRKVAACKKRQFIAKLNKLPSLPVAHSKLAIAQQYFKMLFKSRETSSAGREALLRHIRQLQMVVRLRSRAFEDDPSLDELKSALAGTANLKSPGDSGLGAEFFKAFPLLLTLLREFWLH